MPEQRDVNQVRGFGYMAGILGKHRREPLCRKCKSFAMTAGAVKESLSSFDGSPGSKALSQEMMKLYSEAKKIIAGLEMPAEPVPQRKLGKCSLPDKECFLQHSMAFFKKIEE